MKIIKRGVPPEEKTIEMVCRNCGSELEATRNEGRREASPRNESFLVFVCPVCKKDIWVEQ